jgi:hypothetical protein
MQVPLQLCCPALPTPLAGLVDWFDWFDWFRRDSVDGTRDILGDVVQISYGPRAFITT